MTTTKTGYSILLTSIAAGLGYGGWAVYANFSHGLRAAAMAAIVQGIYAFALTGCITRVARWGFLRYGGIQGWLAGFGMSFLAMLTIPLVVHSAVGTPEIGQTILPGLIWGSIYLIGFLYALGHHRRMLPKKETVGHIEDNYK